MYSKDNLSVQQSYQDTYRYIKKQYLPFRSQYKIPDGLLYSIVDLLFYKHVLPNLGISILRIIKKFSFRLKLCSLPGLFVFIFSFRVTHNINSFSFTTFI